MSASTAKDPLQHNTFCRGMNDLRAQLLSLREKARGKKKELGYIRVRVKLLTPEEIRQSPSYSLAPHNHRRYYTEFSSNKKILAKLDAIIFYIRILQDAR